ncbi:phage holin family protein [Bacillus sp. 1P10SD]|jgi:putative membrane protein|uniref:phage holin family protein n=1 Tax=unclassified Bacillus (in: firmicutes) TaxID=185979 RepID=UPI002858B626|nr:phage holin family protein [Bacillus sp. SLBN-46]MDR6121671.1 putative membrane protein [Bacillus sp. SLBN-46]
MRWLIGCLINAVLFMALAGYFHESFQLTGFWAAIQASILLSILNVLVRPLLILFTLPVTILSMGLFLFVINAITLELTDYLMGEAFEIQGFGMALFFAVMMSLVNIIIHKTILDPSRKSKDK